jgi:predicted nucleic acid-binding protein
MILVDATTVYDLGMVGELELLGAFDGEIVIPDAVVEAVSVEPAATNLRRFLAEYDVATEAPWKAADVDDDADVDGDFDADAAALLGDNRPPSDRALIAALLAGRAATTDDDPPIGFVSDDRRLRAIADGLGGTVTGTFGVVVRAALDDKYFPASQAKRVIRRLDQHGLQSTGPLRSRAVGAIED